MRGAEDRGGDATVFDFQRRRRVDGPTIDGSSSQVPECSDPETLEATALIDQVLGGPAVTPPGPPPPESPGPEPAPVDQDGERDEFFDELLNQDQPSDPPNLPTSVGATVGELEDPDPWFDQQGDPLRHHAARTNNRARANGTADLPAPTRRPRPARRPPAHPDRRPTHTRGRGRRPIVMTAGVIATLVVITITALSSGGQPGKTPTRTEASSLGSIATSAHQKTLPVRAQPHPAAKSTRHRSNHTRARHATPHQVIHRAAQNATSSGVSRAQSTTAAPGTSSTPTAPPVQPAPAPAPTPAPAPSPVSNPTPSHSSTTTHSSTSTHRPIIGQNGTLAPGSSPDS